MGDDPKLGDIARAAPRHRYGAGALSAGSGVARPGVLMAAAACACALAACSTQTRLLELDRDRLLRIEQNATEVSASAGQSLYRPDDYDLYLALHRSTFDSLLEGFNGTTVQIDAGGRPVEITLTSIQMAFRPGSPEVRIDAMARDLETGIEAELEMDSRFLLEGDLSRPDELSLRIVATRLVPNLRWGFFDLSRYRFAQRLLTLEASRLTDQLPAVSLPLAHDFSIGAPRTTRTITVPVGRGTMTGNLTTPSTRTDGQISIKHIVFLRNGVHLFANVEGL